MYHSMAELEKKRLLHELNTQIRKAGPIHLK